MQQILKSSQLTADCLLGGSSNDAAWRAIFHVMRVLSVIRKLPSSVSRRRISPGAREISTYLKKFTAQRYCST